MSAKEVTRVAVIGCGFYGQNHLHAWNDLIPKGAALVAVCDLDAEKARSAGETFGATWFTDVDEMLDKISPDLVDVATQMRTHRVLSAKMAERKIAAVIQKPFAPNLEECIAIVEHAEEQGAWLAVHENFRFSTAMQRVKAEIDKGAIGLPNWARLSFRTGYDIYSGQPYLMQEPRLSILDTGVHLLDLARFFMGEVDRVSCETQRRNSAVKGDDTATLLLHHTSGAVSVVETTYESKRIPDYFPNTQLEIEGPDGSILLSQQDTMTVTSAGKASTEQVGSALLPWTAQPWHGSQEAVLRTNAHMLDSFRANRPADTSGVDNLKTFALAEAAYESAATHVAISPRF